MWTYKCVVLVFIFCAVNSETTNPFVVTDFGTLKGLKADDGDYTMYLGIPFAQVNISNPFGAATAHPGFVNTFEAYDDTYVCPQRDMFNNTVTGTLDCLRLNIFVPLSATSSNRLPVLVWIHGGGFETGSNNRNMYGPQFLVRHDIILVSVNYRLGPYGFMCLDTPEVPGNQGLKDQLLALRWINKNIEAFGGDGNRVTIFGQSAGSMSVDAHLKSNTEKLFHKAILQSGNTLCPVFYEPLRTAPMVLAEQLGYSTDANDEALEFLANTDPHLVIAAVNELELNDKFRPCIEKEFDFTESFITRTWTTADLPKVRNMPILIGFNENEKGMLDNSKIDDFYDKLSTLHGALAADFDENSDEFKSMIDIVHHFYFGDAPISSSVKQDLIDFGTDFCFGHPTYRTISKYLENNVGNIFFYIFSHVGERNFGKIENNVTVKTGATHGEELAYLFDAYFIKNLPINQEDQLIIDRITTMWTNFVKNGNPTPQTSDLLPFQWTPITSNSRTPYLNIDSQMILGSRPFNTRATFWDLFYKTYEHLQVDYSSAKDISGHDYMFKC